MGQPLRGIVTALATPLSDQRRPDEAGLRRLVQYQLAGGVAGLFACSSTGEGPMLRDADWDNVLRWTVDEVAGRAVILAHCSDTGTERVLDRAERAAALGAQAIATTAPMFYPVDPSEVCPFFREVADRSPLPVYIYNIPLRVRVALTADQVLELAAHPRLIGLKDSSRDAVFQTEVIHRVRAAGLPFAVLSGTEATLGESAFMGADGAVLGVANLAPRLSVDLFEAGARGDMAAVRELQPRLTDVISILLLPGCTFAGNLKRALQLMGLCGEAVMHPFALPGEAADRQIREILARNGLMG